MSLHTVSLYKRVVAHCTPFRFTPFISCTESSGRVQQGRTPKNLQYTDLATHSFTASFWPQHPKRCEYGTSAHIGALKRAWLWCMVTISKQQPDCLQLLHTHLCLQARGCGSSIASHADRYIQACLHGCCVLRRQRIASIWLILVACCEAASSSWHVRSGPWLLRFVRLLSFS